MKTIEQKAKTYDEALERAKTVIKCDKIFNVKDALECVFEELRESENERIRKSLVDYFDDANKADENPLQNYGIQTDKVIDWLEKQGEQKSDDKVEPKFKVGDWITSKSFGNTVQIKRFDKEGKVWFDNGTGTFVDFLKDYRFATKDEMPKESKFKVGDWIVDKSGLTQQVLDFRGGIYTCTYNGFTTDCESNYHLWTIDDAKDGDVLAYVTDEEDLWLMIYWSLYEPYEGHVHYHALLVNNDFSDKGTCCICIDDLHPATKEQRSFLFQKMHETGYTFDFEKKELKEIVNEIEIPFGAKDSELQEATYLIPEGFHAEIKDNEVLIKKGEKKSTWKPSEEQMNALDSTLQYSQVSHNSFEHLNSLFNDLKKLK